MAVDLGKQVGPLPLGAWLAVVAAGLGIAYTTRNGGGGGTATEDEPMEDTGGVPGVGTGAVGGWVSTSPSSQINEPSVFVPTSNDEWGAAAVTWLIAQGYPPMTADSAMRKYLENQTLSPQEFALMVMVLAKRGAPPTILAPPTQSVQPGQPGKGLPPKPKTVPKPVPTRPRPKPKPTPPRKSPRSVRYYVVVRGDNLSRISMRYYRNPLLWVRIYNANRKGVRRVDNTPGMILSPHSIQPGWKLVIP